MIELIMITTIFFLHFCSVNIFSAMTVDNVTRKVHELAIRDQAIRKDIIMTSRTAKVTVEQIKRLQKVDHNNLANLNKILKQNKTLPIESQIFLHDLWLLTQHADSDFALQNKILRILKSISKTNPTERKHYAYLYDRIQVNQHLPQRYGTQGRCSNNNQWEVFRVENMKILNKLRVSMGLEDFHHYQITMNHLCFKQGLVKWNSSKNY